MKKIDWQELKQRMDDYHPTGNYGEVFNCVFKVMADLANGEFGKKEEKPADKPKQV